MKISFELRDHTVMSKNFYKSEFATNFVQNINFYEGKHAFPVSKNSKPTLKRALPTK